MLQFIQSTTCSLLTSSLYLITGAVLDMFMDARISNLISMAIGSCANYLLQVRAFNSTVSKTTLGRYIFSDTLFYIVAQILFIICPPYPNNKTYKRTIISIICYMFISYPMRKYFVFNKSKQN